MAFEINPATGRQTRYQIQRLNHRHEQILNWLIANPHQTLEACARSFNYTQAWVSQVVHSDAFQARYRQRCEEMGAATIHTMKDKLTHLAVVTVEKLTDKVVAGGVNEKGMCETLNLTLKALGYGGDAPSGLPAAPSQHLHVHVDAASLAEARQLAAQTFQGQTEKKLNNHGELAALPAA